jgi:signal transduction histidine kinase
LLIILLLLGFYLTTALRSFYIDRLRENMLQTGALLVEALQTNPDLANNSGRIQELLSRFNQQTPMRIQVIGRDGIILSSTEPSDVPLISTTSQEAAVLEALEGKVSYKTSNNDVATVALPVTSGGQIGAVRLSLQIPDVATMFNRLDWLVITGILALSLLSLFIAYTIGTALSRSFHKLAEEAESVAAGDYSRRLEVKGDLEVSDLARHFNNMVDKLSEQRAARLQLLNDIAHELRRPIAAIRAAIEVIQGAATKVPEPIRQLEEALVWEMDRLGRLTRRLDYATQDKFTPDPARQKPVNIAETLHRVITIFEPEAEKLGITLTSHLPETLPLVKADNDALTEVFTNLMDNALKFTPNGGQVTVSAGTTQERVWIHFNDTGMGLTNEEQMNLFNRFYRGDPSRSRPHGIGLGLAISQELLQAQGGTIRVSSAPDQGTTFIIELTC